MWSRFSHRGASFSEEVQVMSTLSYNGMVEKPFRIKKRASAGPTEKTVLPYCMLVSVLIA